MQTVVEEDELQLELRRVAAAVPTPLALVLHRVQLSQPKSQERFDSAELLAEATIKFAAITALSVVRSEDAERAGRVARALVRSESIGTWATKLTECCQRLHRAKDPLAHEFARGLTRKHSLTDAPAEVSRAILALQAVLTQLGEPDYEGLARNKHNVLSLMSDFVFIRNRTRGHGAKTWQFYASTAESLAAAAAALALALPTALRWALVNSPPDLVGSAWAISLVGPAPSDSVPLPPEVSVDRGSLVILGSGAPYTAEPLVEIDPTSFNASWANGAWKDASAVCQFLDYRTGTTAHLHRPAYAGAAVQLAPSETEGRRTLTYTDWLAHNLPSRPTTYVRRSLLESRLRELLDDKVHRVITLRGPGGMGKTSLALCTLHELAEAPAGFDVILWFSARDVDLLPQGPRARQQDVAGLDDILKDFCELTGRMSTDDYRATFESEVDGSSSQLRYLLVMDNFETLEAPDAVLRYLDAHVVLPSKVLVTTRHQAFQGDFPVPVTGMERHEAEELIRSESRLRFCEGQLDEEWIRQAIEATGASPFALKLAVSQVGAGQSPRGVVQAMLNREDVLTALFDRTFEGLSDDGAFLYLLLGAAGKEVALIPIEAAMALEGLDFESGLDELVRASIVVDRGTSKASGIIGLVQMAYPHAKKMLLGHDLELTVSQLAKDFRRWAAPRAGVTNVASFFENIFAEAANWVGSDQIRWQRLVSLAELAAQDYPDLWPKVVEVLVESEPDPERVRTAFKSAVEALPQDPNTWRAWSDFERRVGNEEQSLIKATRAVECQPEEVAYASEVSVRLVRYISDNGDFLQVSSRRALVASVREAMEAHRRNGSLSGDELSRLAWLYFVEYRPETGDSTLLQKVREIAQDGLRLDPSNEHCQRLNDRVSDGPYRVGENRRLEL